MSWSCPAKITFLSLVIKTKGSEIVRFQTDSPCFTAGPIWEQSYRKYTFNSMSKKTPSYIPSCKSKHVWFHEPWLNIHDINSNVWLYKLSQDWTYTSFFCSLYSVCSYNQLRLLYWYTTSIHMHVCTDLPKTEDLCHQLKCISAQTEPRLNIYMTSIHVCVCTDWTKTEHRWHQFKCIPVQI